MKVVVKEQILIFPESTEEIEIIKKKARENLVFTDPSEIPKFGAYSSMPRLISIFKYDSKKKYFIVPRGKQEFLEILARAGLKLTDYKDQRRIGKSIKFKANFKLRDEIQKQAFENYLASKTNMGILNLGCGIGGM